VSSVLNIGAGSCHLEMLLAKRGVNIHTLDPCEQTIIRLQNLPNINVCARQGYSHDIPFPRDSFDIVIMTEVLEHIHSDYLDLTLGEVRRVLKRNGRFIGTVPYREHLRDNEVFCPFCHSSFHRWGHLHSFDLMNLRALFERNNLTICLAYPRAFTDFTRPSLKMFGRAVFRYILGRLGEPIVSPCIYFEATVSHKL